MVRQIALRNPVLVHVGPHHFGEDVRENEYLAFALVRVREVAQHFADELAIHVAFGIAHLFVAHRDPRIAHAELQLVNHRKHGLPSGCAGVLHGFDGLALHPRSHGHQAGQQSLLVQREVAGRTDASHVQ